MMVRPVFQLVRLRVPQLTALGRVQLRTDMALSTDKGFKPYAQKYAKDENAFFSDFSQAFSK